MTISGTTRALLAAVVVCVAATPSRGAITIQGFDPDLHDRFANEGSFIGNPHDWSGVGQTSSVGHEGYWGTMISPSYFVSSNHYRPTIGSTLRFYLGNDSSGTNYEERTVASGWQVSHETLGPSDLWLGKLSAPVSSSVATYPILSLDTFLEDTDLTMFTFGLSANDGDGNRADDQRLGRNHIDPGAISTYYLGWGGVTQNRSLVYDYDTVGGVGADESYVQVGDSGGPSFVLAGPHGNTPALVGIHTAQTGWPVGSLDTFVPFYADAIVNRIDFNGDWDTDAVAMVTPVPEPGTLALLGMAAAVGGGLAVRRARHLLA